MQVDIDICYIWSHLKDSGKHEHIIVTLIINTIIHLTNLLLLQFHIIFFKFKWLDLRQMFFKWLCLMLSKKQTNRTLRGHSLLSSRLLSILQVIPLSSSLTQPHPPTNWSCLHFPLLLLHSPSGGVQLQLVFMLRQIWARRQRGIAQENWE